MSIQIDEVFQAIREKEAVNSNIAERLSELTQSLSEAQRGLKDFAAGQLLAIRKRLISGETTGNPLNDGALMYFGLHEKKFDDLNALNSRIIESEGQQLLFGSADLRWLADPGGMPWPETTALVKHSFILGNLSGKSLGFEYKHYQDDLGSLSLILPFTRYVLWNYPNRSGRAELREGSCRISLIKILTSGHDGYQQGTFTSDFLERVLETSIPFLVAPMVSRDAISSNARSPEQFEPALIELGNARALLVNASIEDAEPINAT